MSRRTSDLGDSLAIQDGYRDGKNTTWKAREPDMSLDFNDAASSVQRYISSGDKRWLDLVRNFGAVVARGTAASYNGMLRGRDFGDEFGIPSSMEGSKFAAMLTKDIDGITIWIPEMISADEFQWANRGANGGKIDDSDDGYLLAEDPRNKQYSIAVYTPKGKIPKEKVYQAYMAGQLEKDFAEEFFNADPIYGVKRAKDQADALKKQREAAAILAAARPKPVIGTDTWELSVSSSNVITAAKTSTESQQSTQHPGVPVAGTDWETISSGKSPAELGLPRAIVALQGDGSIAAAVQEYNSIRLAAQKGDRQANAALSQLGYGFDESQLPGDHLDFDDLFGNLF